MEYYEIIYIYIYIYDLNFCKENLFIQHKFIQSLLGVNCCVSSYIENYVCHQQLYNI